MLRIPTFVLFATVLVLVSGCTSYGGLPKEEAAMTVQRVPGPTGTLSVDDGGTGGLPVVFIHSFAGNKTHWAAQLTHLRKTRRALAFDLRGHGDSTTSPQPDYEVDALAQDIVAVTDGLRLKRFVLVGHSMGGAAAIAYAGAHPERVAGLVLVGTPGQTPNEQSCQIMAALEADYENVMEDYRKSILSGARPSVEARLRNEMKSISRDDSLAIIKGIFANDPIPALGRYPGPKLLVVTPHGESPGSLHNLVPDVPRRVVNGTSHWPHLDKPQEFNQLLDSFLSTLL